MPASRSARTGTPVDNLSPARRADRTRCATPRAEKCSRQWRSCRAGSDSLPYPTQFRSNAIDLPHRLPSGAASLGFPGRFLVGGHLKRWNGIKRRKPGRDRLGIIGLLVANGSGWIAGRAVRNRTAALLLAATRFRDRFRSADWRAASSKAPARRCYRRFAPRPKPVARGLPFTSTDSSMISSDGSRGSRYPHRTRNAGRGRSRAG